MLKMAAAASAYLLAASSGEAHQPAKGIIYEA